MGRLALPLDQEAAALKAISAAECDAGSTLTMPTIAKNTEDLSKPSAEVTELKLEMVDKIMDALTLEPSPKVHQPIIPECSPVVEEPLVNVEEQHTIGEEKSFPSINRSSLEDECEAFCRHINSILPAEKFPILETGKYLPLQVSSFFNSLRDGVILAFLLNAIQPDIIPISAISIGIKISKTKSSYKALHSLNENLRLVLNAAKEIGSIHLVNIGVEDIQSGNKHLILGLVWQLIRLWYISGLKNLSPSTSDDKIESNHTNLSAESILIRWINDTLSLDRPISNMGTDMVDCRIYAMLLEKIFDHGSKISDLIKQEPNYEARAALIVDSVSSILPHVRAEDISDPRLNLCMVAELFKVAQSTAKSRHTEEIRNNKAEISGWEATLQAERSSYANQLATLSDQHSKTVDELDQKLHQALDLLNEQKRTWEEQFDSVGIAIAALATRINHIAPDGEKDILSLSILLQNNSSLMELIAYCQTQLDRIEGFQKQLLEDKSKLCTTLSLNKHANELMSARVREFSQELAEKKKASGTAGKRSKSPSLKSRILSWGSGSPSQKVVRPELN